MANLKEYIEARKSDYYKFTEDFVRAESPTRDKKMVELCGQGVKEFCESEGIKVAFKEFSHCGNYLELTVNDDCEGKPVLLMGHLDTVHPIGSYGENPVSVEGDILHGPGSEDCKSGVVAGILAMKAVKECGIKRKVIFLLAAAEEDSAFAGQEVADYLTERSRGGLCCMNMEPSSATFATVARKGIVRIRVEIHGKAAHAGTFYDKGISAIKEAAHKIIEIESASDINAVTYNCGTITGGTVANTVPEFCSFVIDIRCPRVDLMEEAIARIEDICSKPTLPGAEVKCVYLGKRAPMEHTPANDKLLAFINEVAEEIGYPVRSPRFKGGGSDSCYSSLVGVPTICSFGATGGGGHTLNEFCNLSSIPTQAYHVAEVIARIPEDF